MTAQEHRVRGGRPRNQPNQNFIISELLQLNKELTTQLVELARELAHLKETVQSPVPMYDTTPAGNMHMPESEEDARHMRNVGEITQDQLEDTLKEIGFYNAEITVPS